MSSKRVLVVGVLFVLAAGLMACVGCGGTQPKPPATVIGQEFDGAPCWVTKGCGCFFKDSDKTKYVCGVGSVGGTRNPGLAREAALGRARTEIARSLQVQVQSMLKDYQATTTGGEEFGGIVISTTYSPHRSPLLTTSLCHAARAVVNPPPDSHPRACRFQAPPPC